MQELNKNLSVARLINATQQFSNGIVAISDFDLAVCEGERVSVLGPSGCGKSTALRLLAGLDAPSGGVVETPQNRPGETALSLVFQDATLLPWATVFDNIFMPLKLQSTSRAEARPAIEDMLERMELSQFSQSYPRELSGGMKMRVSIARALITKPRLLLMDEPFAALDEITRFKLNDMLLEQQEKEGFGLLFVTHSIFESVYLSHRVVVMTPRPGRVSAIVETLKDHPRTDDFRTSPQYIEACRQVSQALQTAMM